LSGEANGTMSAVIRTERKEGLERSLLRGEILSIILFLILFVIFLIPSRRATVPGPYR
jgi:hypothetical protein